MSCDFKLREPDRSKLAERRLASLRFLAAASGRVEMAGMNPLDVEMVVVPMIRQDKVDVVEAKIIIVEVSSVIVEVSVNFVVEIYVS
jgi:hypothetical protein